jgi:hypothetical protein
VLRLQNATWKAVLTNASGILMKTIFAVLFILCAASAFGQVAGSISSQPIVLTLPEHVEHAAPHDMGTETSLLGGTGQSVTVAQGERPLWEFGPVKQEVPLGDVARAYRKQKLTAKKAEIILEKQGS